MKIEINAKLDIEAGEIIELMDGETSGQVLIKALVDIAKLVIEKIPVQEKEESSIRQGDKVQLKRKEDCMIPENPELNYPQDMFGKIGQVLLLHTNNGIPSGRVQVYFGEGGEITCNINWLEKIPNKK